ncbi:hypothetical protein PAL_GLEAN10007330 [Pteropus alecto]|uniref:Uncharacterized protein n=1 Tax=Pteropus alecto TaxID=9402 RepID=L5JTE9_PTEAL|nr:hypothetical protein PAL_GLEAN10007330 [Pteropus alecto]
MPLWLNTPAFAEAHVFPSPFAHADAQEVTDFAEAIVTLLFRFVQRTWKPCDSSSDGFFIVNNALYTVTQVLYLFGGTDVLPATESYDLMVLLSLVRMKLSQLTVA